MIELNKKTQQDFLNREWVQRLLDAGIDMSDAKYCIGKRHADDVEFIWYAGKYNLTLAFTFIEGFKMTDVIPTYTVSELLYKLHEYVYPTIYGKKYSGGLKFLKDAPFYTWYYDLKNKFTEEGESNQMYLCAESEYPIESLAMLLIQCHMKDIGMERKDTGDINSK